MFSKPLSPFQEPKTNKRIFQSEPEVLPCFELNYKFLERHKKPLSLATTTKQKNPVNMAQKMASKSSTKQGREVKTEEVPGSIVTYMEEEINTIKDDAIGLQNPRSLLHLVWWNDVTHLGMRAFKEQYDCQIEDFTVSEEYVKYKERQTKNRQGDEGSSRKQAQKYNTKIWKTDGAERDPYQAFVEYISHRPQGGKVHGKFFPNSS